MCLKGVSLQCYELPNFYKVIINACQILVVLTAAVLSGKIPRLLGKLFRTENLASEKSLKEMETFTRIIAYLRICGHNM